MTTREGNSARSVSGCCINLVVEAIREVLLLYIIWCKYMRMQWHSHTHTHTHVVLLAGRRCTPWKMKVAQIDDNLMWEEQSTYTQALSSCPGKRSWCSLAFGARRAFPCWRWKLTGDRKKDESSRRAHRLYYILLRNNSNIYFTQVFQYRNPRKMCSPKNEQLSIFSLFGSLGDVKTLQNIISKQEIYL